MKMPPLKFLLLLGLLSGHSQAAAPPVSAELLADRTALTAGANTIGLHLILQPGWHVYWRNPGGLGKAPSLEWQLPDDIHPGELQWPVPETLQTGSITSYVYTDSVLLPMSLALSHPFALNGITLKARVRWLACRDACIPGQATVALSLPVSDTAGSFSPQHPLFDDAAAKLPQPMPGTVESTAVIHANRISTELAPLTALGRFTQAHWLTATPDLVAESRDASIRIDGDRLIIDQLLGAQRPQRLARLEGVLQLTDTEGTRSLRVDSPLVIDAGFAQAPATEGGGASVSATLFALAFAFLGGLILNLMPCVLPVLSMKALALAGLDARDRRAHRRSALAYTAGVVGSGLALGAGLLALRAAGHAIGWGFQLQSPIVVSLLAYLMFAMALSLSGIVEFGGTWMGAGESLTQRSGWQGSFFTGVLAMVAASPCTAPFMGTALGYALTQPPALAMAVFAMLALGLASPFLLIAWIPALASRLPRPGAWMNSFRKSMALPLYLTVVWLVWVLARQAGADAVALLLSGFVALGLALALWQHTHWLARTARRVSIATALALAAAPTVHGSPAIADASALHQPWSPVRVAELRQQGKIVFVNFTADWCLTCKVNESSLLADVQVREALSRPNVAWLTADWTNSDPQIAAELQRFGRSGVPLYVLYRPDRDAEVLPQILTPQRLLQDIGTQPLPASIPAQTFR